MHFLLGNIAFTTMAAPSMVSRDGENTIVKSVDAVFGASEGEDNDSGQEDGAGNQHDGVEFAQDDQDPRQLPQCKIKRNYSCTLCDYYTQNPRFYLYHQKQVHKEKIKIFECPHCLYASKHSQKLQRHIHMVHVMGKKRMSKTKVRLIKQKAARLRRLQPTAPPELPPTSEAPPSPGPEEEEDGGEPTIIEDKPEPIFAPDGTPIFKCSVCDMTSKSQMLVARHERVVHLKKRVFRCVKCNYMTHMKARYTKHVKYHSMPMIKCDMCDFKTPYKWNLDRHNKNHQGDGQFKCVMCNFTADIKQSLTVHEMNHHVPPVGHMAIVGGRRRLRVGASDTLGMLENEPIADVEDMYDPEAGMDNSMEPQNPADFLQTQLDEIPVQPTTPPVMKFSMRQVLVPAKMPGQGSPTRGIIPIHKYKCKVCLFSGNLGEVQRHEATVHGLNDLQASLNDVQGNLSSKKRRPVPSLIPIQGQQSLLKPPSERGGDLSNSSFNDVNNHDDSKPLSSAGSKSTSPVPSDDRKFHETFKRKNATFFDKLKEKLMTNSTDRDLACNICGFESKCLSEHMKHQKMHSDGEESYQGELSSTRCQHCRQRCKTSVDLMLHLKTCSALSAGNDTSYPHVKVEQPDQTETPKKPLEDENRLEGRTHPMENKVFVWNNFASSHEEKSSAPFEMNFYTRQEDREPLQNFQMNMNKGPPPSAPLRYEDIHPPYPPRETTRKVFKCPNCSFWASTASRFHVHIVGHLNKRPFQCSLCHYSSNWRWDITKHIRLKQLRDTAHEKARVLLTDEAGRRNYSKYNKYLITISAEEYKKAQQPRKLPKENGEVPTTKTTPKKSDSKNEEEDQEKESTDKKPCQVNKKTMWKCKKCLFRNGDRSVVLAHVKEHYRTMNQNKALVNPPTQQNSTPPQEVGTKPTKDSEKDEPNLSDPNIKIECPDFMCETCPFTCDTLAQLEEHAERHFVTQGANIKCQFCPFYADNSEQLMEHLDLHEPPDASDDTNKSVVFACLDCPYVGTTHQQLVYHRQWHQKSLPHKCFKCNYSAYNNIILSLHVRVHGRGMVDGPDISVPKHQEPNFSADISGIDTSNFPDIPMVWVSKPMGISKMFKCRHCPHVNMRKSNIQEHEKMHSLRSQTLLEDNQTPHHCPECNYICNNAGVLSSHMKVHQGFFGQICGVVDYKKTDEEQIEEMKRKVAEYEDTLKPLTETSDVNGGENEYNVSGDAKDGLVLHFCPICPARFLYLKEILIHLRFHTLPLPFKCESCSYSARQKHHLLAHLKVHTGDYQERTTALCSLYPTDKDYPRQKVVVVLGTPSESGWTWKSESVWVVVKSEREEPTENEKENEENVKDREYRKKKTNFACDICPAEFIKEVALQCHKRLHGGSGVHKCRFCDYAVKTYGNLIKHEALHNNTPTKPRLSNGLESPHKPDSLKVSPQKSPIQHDPEFGSLIFGNPDFIYPTYLKNGKMREKKYKCHKCPSAFEKREQYKIHLSLHGAKQRYNCDKCDYSVKYFANYTQHMKKHSMNENAQTEHKREMFVEEKDDEIPETPLSKTSTKSLGLKMSVADQQTLMIMQSRNTALSNQTRDEISRCSFCPYANNRKDGLLHHVKCHGNPKGGAFTCKFCDYTVAHKNFFKDHSKVHFSTIRYSKPDMYMKCEKLELWAEPDDPNHNSGETLVFKDCGTGKNERFFPPMDNNDDFESIKGRVYINLKTGEEEIEMDDDDEEAAKKTVNGDINMEVDEDDDEDEREESEEATPMDDDYPNDDDENDDGDEEEEEEEDDDGGGDDDENSCDSSASSRQSSRSAASLSVSRSSSVTNTSQQD